MHTHISWLQVLVTLLSFIVFPGALNIWARGSQSSLARSWKLVASPN